MLGCAAGTVSEDEAGLGWRRGQPLLWWVTSTRPTRMPSLACAVG